MSETLDPEIEGYNRKHKRIRGTHALKYPPRESRCQKGCGSLHCAVETRKGKEYREHPCFLEVDHKRKCEFSSECALLLTGRRAA